MSPQSEDRLRRIAFTVVCSAWLPTEVANHQWFAVCLLGLLLAVGVWGLWSDRA